MNNKARLTLEKRHQLIDLNKEYVNFDITFECRAVDATKDFEIIVVNQEQLNTIDLTNLTMKLTKNGYISGNSIADEDKYQNYFLILRAPTEEPIEVDLEIRIKQIEAKEHAETSPQFPQSQPMVPPPVADHLPYTGDQLLPCQPSQSVAPRTHLIFIVVGLLIIGGAVGYYFWKNSKKADGPLLTMEDDARSVYSDHSAVSKSSASSDDKGILDTLLQKSK